MKKTNNKGFSLVELIIVIAIMAILAGAIAPALIRYIDKSRKSNDVSACKAIKTAIETAMSNEEANSALTPNTDAPVVVSFKPKADLSTLSATTAVTGSADTILITGSTGASEGEQNVAYAEIAKNLGSKNPKISYTKAAKDKSANPTPDKYYAIIDKNGAIYVGIGGSTAPTAAPSMDSGKYKCTTAFHVLVPDVCEHYAK